MAAVLADPVLPPGDDIRAALRLGVTPRPVLQLDVLRHQTWTQSCARYFSSATPEVADSRAVLNGRNLGPSGALMRQARLGDFRMPQRGIGMVGSGHFEAFDPQRHRRAERELSYA